MCKNQHPGGYYCPIHKLSSIVQRSYNQVLMNPKEQFFKKNLAICQKCSTFATQF